MAGLDFKEIPPANTGDGEQDTFELFCRDFFTHIGYVILEGPDRGADGGRDLLVEEKRTGPGGETRVRWLVSCKHHAHSGTSVTPKVEQDIRDRMETHRCDGFIGFYSTIPSAGLAAKLDPDTIKGEVQVFDRGRIEEILLSSTKGIDLARRFFPASIDSWKNENPQPAKIFSDTPELRCANCDKNLLEPENSGIVVIWYRDQDAPEGALKHYEEIYCCCKGQCDRKLQAVYRSRGLRDGWKDISDLILPTGYIIWVMTALNSFQRGLTYSESAFENLKQVYLNVFPFVSRQLTEKEKKRVEDLLMIPDVLGGFGR